ncbi:MAG: hypothetical protein HY268_23265 [Deltaproteobacteria bacterium]|nr:hypothetical protein [Deltaproteobacteria bacterium]
MKLYNADKPLISLHIPKCSWTSFRSVLEQWFGANFYLHYSDGPLREERPRKYELTGGTCVHGHFNQRRNIGVQDYYPEAEQFITILRDPFEMAVSYYFYAKGLGENRFTNGKPRQPIQEKFCDVSNYLRKGRKKRAVVKYLPYKVTFDNYEEMFEKYFIYLGLTEDLQTSVDVLARRLGFASVLVGRVNTSVHDEEVTAELREEFISTHPLEYAIYDYAVRHYKQ